jgi:hypothetical protein
MKGGFEGILLLLVQPLHCRRDLFFRCTSADAAGLVVDSHYPHLADGSVTRTGVYDGHFPEMIVG